jgi:hypothetical protein
MSEGLRLLQGRFLTDAVTRRAAKLPIALPALAWERNVCSSLRPTIGRVTR